MFSETHIRFLTQQDKKEALKLLYRAFEHDDVVTSFIRTKNELKNKPKCISLSCQNIWDKAVYSNNQIWGMFNEKNKLVSVAIVEKSTKSRFQLQHVFSNMMFLFKMFFFFSVKSVKRFVSFNKKLEDNKKMFDSQNLEIFAVSPDMQGKGYGKKLLQSVIKYNQQLNLYNGMLLYTQNKTNVEIYKKIGFSLTKEIIAEDVPMYFMYTPYQKQ